MAVTKQERGITVLSVYELGDILVKYEIDEGGKVGFTIIPLSKRNDEIDDKYARVNNLVQYKLVGDYFSGGYANGITMRNSASIDHCKYENQTVSEDEEKVTVDTVLKDDRGYEIHHVVVWYRSDVSLEIYTTFENKSEGVPTLEYISSYEIGGLTPFVSAYAPDSMVVHRLRSKWSEEARLVSNTVEDLQLEPSWTNWSNACERFGSIGSMPNNKYMPFVAVEDVKSGVTWGAQLMIESSWQMDIYRADEGLHIDGGIADRDFGHWMKKIEIGEKFETPHAIVSVCREGGVDILSQRLTQALQKHVNKRPESEQHLPVMFNEYCTTWGVPSADNIRDIANAIEGHGFEYFVIDAGWYKKPDVSWDRSVGEYDVSSEMFPEGIDKTVELINSKGMKAGLWFEIDNMGNGAFDWDNTDHLLKRDGYVLQSGGRRFRDMNDQYNIDYLTEHVIGTLKNNGFEYIKMDYNDTIGIGCDGCESLGEGLRKNMIGSLNFVKSISENIPGIIIENCSSGGHKIEPLMLSNTSMASFSDAHECTSIPKVAADLHRMMLPRQNQIWCVIRETDSLKRIAYSIANTFLGRMCLSGDVLNLTEEQWKVIDNGVDFYKSAAEIIKDGTTYFYGPKITSEKNLVGWQGIVRTGKNGEAYVVIHTFNGQLPEKIVIDLPANCPTRVEKMYSDDDITNDIVIKNGKIVYTPRDNMKAVVIKLVKEPEAK